MVLAVPYNVQADAIAGSGSVRNVINPPAIGLSLTDEELPSHYAAFSGSGGSLNSCLNAVSSSGGKVIIICVNDPQPTDFKGTLNYISTAFSLTKEELAQVCQVQSRKTLYNWMDGQSAPRQAALERVFKLYMVAQDWNKAGIDYHKNDIHVPVVDGRSIFDLLKSDHIDGDMIMFARSRMQLMRGATKALADPFS